MGPIVCKYLYNNLKLASVSKKHVDKCTRLEYPDTHMVHRTVNASLAGTLDFSDSDTSVWRNTVWYYSSRCLINFASRHYGGPRGKRLIFHLMNTVAWTCATSLRRYVLKFWWRRRFRKTVGNHESLCVKRECDRRLNVEN